MTKERFPINIVLKDGSTEDEITGFTHKPLVKDDTVHVYFNDGTSEIMPVESLNTSYLDNPLNGLTEITIKLQLRKEVEDDNI